MRPPLGALRSRSALSKPFEQGLPIGRGSHDLSERSNTDVDVCGVSGNHGLIDQIGEVVEVVIERAHGCSRGCQHLLHPNIFRAGRLEQLNDRRNEGLPSRVLASRF